MLSIYFLARPRAPGAMRAQLGPQASMQMRRGMPRGMAPTRNVGAAPQATVHRPGGEVHPARPKSRRPPESGVQRKPATPTEGMFDFKKKKKEQPPNHRNL